MEKMINFILNFLFLFMVSLSLIFDIDVFAKEYEILDTTDRNYQVDLRIPNTSSIIGRTTISDGIITSTCAYLDNSTGCAIQFPLKENLKIPANKEISITIIVGSNSNTIPQMSTWEKNVNVMPTWEGIGYSDGVYWLNKLDTTSYTYAYLYKANIQVKYYGVSGSTSLYSITYTFTPTQNINTSVITLAHGMAINSNYVTTGYFSISSILVDATNDEIINKIDETNKKLDETNKKLDDLNGNITSSDVPDKNDLSTKLDTTGWLKPGPIDSILNMPLNLINNCLSSLNSKSCSPLVIYIPYLKNKQLTIPCISSLYSQMGLNDLFNSIGLIASAMILFRYLMGFYKWVDDTLSFRENNWGDF